MLSVTHHHDHIKVHEHKLNHFGNLSINKLPRHSKGTHHKDIIAQFNFVIALKLQKIHVYNQLFF